MEVQDLILADYAAANDRGKFTLVGAGFSRIETQKVPLIHSSMFILVRLKVTMADKGKNKLEIRIVGEKGSIFKAEGDVDVSTDHANEEYLPLPIHIANLKFDHLGVYNIEVSINGEPKKSHFLTIMEKTAGVSA